MNLPQEVPLSLVLGAGSVRGLAHVAVLRVLVEAGFQIREIVGTSVGAVVAAFYAVVGMDIGDIGDAGLSLKSHHLVSWGLLRHASPAARDRWGHFAGVIPHHLKLLSSSSFDHLHHGVGRIGIVAHDALTDSLIVCNNVEPVLRPEDAVRGAAALPGLFPAWKCSFKGREYRLVDGGVKNKLPVDVLFAPPFQPLQVLAVDISSRYADRQANIERVNALKRQFPKVPIDVMCLDTLGGATVFYRSGYLLKLLESARGAALQYVSRVPSRA